MNAGKVRCGRIYDSPRFGWRGLMLDEARHFFGEEKVRQILDLMAYYKLNRFHWHLTDAQGWRLEIRKYPLLTEVGGIGTHSNRNAPAQFYTQEQVRKIVEYAKERHIEIIPLQLPVLLARLFCAQNNIMAFLYYQQNNSAAIHTPGLFLSCSRPFQRSHARSL